MKTAATFSWQELLNASGGISVSPHLSFESVTLDTDTRTLSAGSFFLPLSGENHNGNTFIEQAYQQGAEGAFVETAYLSQHPQLTRFSNLIEVPNALVAYQALAHFHRKRCGAKVVAITGSSGKTTTKEMLFAMLSAYYGEDNVQKTEKNYNNDVGVAQTLLHLKPKTQVLIVEMGMRGLGQISLLSHCAEPDVAVITNIGPAHIGLLGSLDAILKAKCEIFQGVNPTTGLGVVNGDDPLLSEKAAQYWAGTLDAFSLQEVDDIHTPGGNCVTFNYNEITFSLGLPGLHNVLNTLACIKVCQYLQVPLKKVAAALTHFEAGGGRGEKRQLKHLDQVYVINDAYNANPSSMKVALGAFTDSKSQGLKKIAVLGPMAELGEFGPHYHEDLGAWINTRKGLDGLIIVGEEAFLIADSIDNTVLPVFKVQSTVEAAALIRQQWPQQVVILLKASRSYRFEEIADMLENHTAYALP